MFAVLRVAEVVSGVHDDVVVVVVLLYALLFWGTDEAEAVLPRGDVLRLRGVRCPVSAGPMLPRGEVEFEAAPGSLRLLTILGCVLFVYMGIGDVLGSIIVGCFHFFILPWDFYAIILIGSVTV